VPLMVTNNEPAGVLKLTAKIKHREAEDFAVTGGTCTTKSTAAKKLHAGESCTYMLTFTGDQKDQGTTIGTDFMIIGRFGPAVCPSGDVQSATVTLAGAVN
jgi:hypothetical protein